MISIPISFIVYVTNPVNVLRCLVFCLSISFSLTLAIAFIWRMHCFYTEIQSSDKCDTIANERKAKALVALQNLSYGTLNRMGWFFLYVFFFSKLHFSIHNLNSDGKRRYKGNEEQKRMLGQKRNLQA